MEVSDLDGDEILAFDGRFLGIVDYYTRFLSHDSEMNLPLKLFKKLFKFVAQREIKRSVFQYSIYLNMY